MTTPEHTPAPPRKSTSSDLTPLYAVAGLTDVAVAGIRTTLAHSQERAAQRVSELRSRPLPQADDLARFVRSLPEQARTRLVDVQTQASSYLAEAEAAYLELAGRGKRAVDDAVVSARKLSHRAEERAADVQADLADVVDEQLDKVQEAGRGLPATEAPTPGLVPKPPTVVVVPDIPVSDVSTAPTPAAEVVDEPAPAKDAD